MIRRFGVGGESMTITNTHTEHTNKQTDRTNAHRKTDRGTQRNAQRNARRDRVGYTPSQTPLITQRVVL